MATPAASFGCRVILVSSTLEDDGGIPVCVGQLAEALAGIGVAVEIAGQHASPLAAVIGRAASRSGITVTGFRQPWHPLGQWRAANSLAALVRRRATTAAREGQRLVVHVHGVWVAPVLAAAAAAEESGVDVVISPHGRLREEALRKSPSRKRLVFETCLRRRLAAAQAIHATAPQEAADLERLLSGCRPKLVPLGVVPPVATPSVRPTEGVREAGYLGRILPIKNLAALLGAWSVVRPAGWRLSLTGPGDAQIVGRLRRQAVSLGIDDSVRIQPPVPLAALGDYYSGLDLFILPSRSEAFALTVGEALACGVPAVVTTAAPWDGVVSRACGWCVPPTVEGLVAGIRAATAVPPDALAAMGHRGADWVRSDFSWDTIARRHLAELYLG